MKPALNPFAPGAGTRPPELAGRNEHLERADIILNRIKAGKLERSLILTGLRGVGKTVLLNEISKIAARLGYLSTMIEAPEEKRLAELIAPPIRQILLRIDQGEGNKQKLHEAIMAIRSFASAFTITIGEVGFGVTKPTGIADSGVLENDLKDLLVSVGEAAVESGIPIAIFCDELQYVKEKELGALFTAIHRVNQLNLPLVFFGAGLPQITGLAGEAKSYAERLFEFREIGPLKEDDARLAINSPIEAAGAAIEKDALEEIIATTEGYPYFLQEWGYHTWNTAAKTPITKEDVQRASVLTLAALDESFFRVRFDRLTTGEKEYLRAMAELGKGPSRSGDIAKKLGRTVEQVAPTRANIISKGMIYSRIHGENAFTVPKFDEYMRRVMPVFPSITRTK